jgi:hypothetical protein
MGFLRRLFGAGEGERPSVDVASGGGDAPGDGDDTDERARELELARGFDVGLTDLQRDQLRYERFAWQPPDQHRGDPADREAADRDSAEGGEPEH